MRVVLVLASLLMLSATSFAASVEVTDFNYHKPVIAIDSNGRIPVNFSLQEKSGVARIVDYNFSVNGKTMDANSFVIDANANKYLSLYWTDLNLHAGTYYGLMKLKIGADPLDVNSVDFNIEVLEGRNISIVSFTADRNSFEPNDLVRVEARVKNSGDSLLLNFSTCIFLDSNIVSCKNVPSLTPGIVEPWILDIRLPAIEKVNEVRLVCDYNNLVRETIESDNNALIIMSTISGVDLAVYSEEISWSGDVVAGIEKEFTVLVKNVGDETAYSVNVVAWIGFGDLNYGNLVYANTFSSIAGGGAKTIKFYYTAPVDGFDVVNVQIDRDNLIVEQNKTNNLAKRGVSIKKTSALGFEAHTTMLEIREKCITLLNNGDRFFSDGIMEAEGGTVVNLKMVDLTGNTLFDGDFLAGEEKVLSGRTIRIISVTKDVAQVMMVYSTPIGILYNTCYVDLEKIVSEKTVIQDKLDVCTGVLAAKEAELTSLNTQRNSSDTQLVSCSSELSVCKQNKDSIETQLAVLNAGCDSKISDETRRLEAADKKVLNEIVAAKDMQIAEKDNTIKNKDKDLAVRNYVLAAVLFGSAIYLLYSKNLIGRSGL